MLDRRAFIKKTLSTGYPLQRMKKRRTVKHGHLPRELTAADVQLLSDGIKGHLYYFPRGSDHARRIRDAAVENYRVQAGRDDAQEELVCWLRLNPRDTRRHRDGLSTGGMEIFVLRVGYLEKYPEPVSLRRSVDWFVTTKEN